jgi:hypothetical protein
MIFLDNIEFIYEYTEEGYTFFNVIQETLPVEQGGDGADEPYTWIFGDITAYEHELKGVENSPTPAELQSDWFDGVHAMVMAAIDRNLPKGFLLNPNGWLAFYNPKNIPMTYDQVMNILYTAIWCSVNIDGVLEQSAEFVKYQAKKEQAN